MRIREHLHTLSVIAATLTASGALIFTPHTSAAANTPTTTATSTTAQCGVIVAPQQPPQPGNATIERPIDDCGNPFQAQSYTLPFSFSVEGALVTHGATLTLSGTSTTDYHFHVDEHAPPYTLTLYRHEEPDLVYYPIRHVATGQERAARVHEAARTVFASSTRANRAATAFLNREPPPAGVSPQAYDTFTAVAHAALSTRAALTPGTYTAVYRERSAPSLVKRALWQRILASLFGIRAHADAPPHPEERQPIHAITFTLKAPASPATSAASNVLFLPGIKASRLYRADGDTLGERVWEPGSNNDVRALAMTARGSSTESLRTKDVVDEAAIPVFGANIYKDFISFMDDLVAEEVITAWEPFAYDWRYSVFDVVAHGTPYADGSRRYPVAAVERLAATAKSGQVTIVAHSNGGLLAKALLLALERSGKADLVDRVVFVGTPHHGTPQTYGVMLHGANQEQVFGWVVDDVVARTVMRNVPATYHLLPSATYHDETKDALITFATTTPVTEAFQTAYGEEITDIATTDAFLRGDAQVAMRTGSSAEEIHIPARLNSVLLGEARADHEQKLRNWQPPEGIAVYNVVGVGLPTVAGLHYRSVTEKDCLLPIIDVLNCTEREYLKPFVRFTLSGDDTVTSTGARLQGQRTLFFDLPTYRDDEEEQDVRHANLLETDILRSFLTEQILDEENQSNWQDYLHDELPQINGGYDIESIDSPLNIFAEDKYGNQTGVVKGELKEEIPGGKYYEVGGTKYLLIPSNLKRKTFLEGHSHGSFTYTVQTIEQGSQQQVIAKLENISTSPDMRAVVEKKQNTFKNSALEIDNDGDGEADRTIPLSGRAATSTSQSADTEVSETSSAMVGYIVQSEPETPTGRVLGVTASVTDNDDKISLQKRYLQLLQEVVRVLQLYKAHFHE